MKSFAQCVKIFMVLPHKASTVKHPEPLHLSVCCEKTPDWQLAVFLDFSDSFHGSPEARDSRKTKLPPPIPWSI